MITKVTYKKLTYNKVTYNELTYNKGILRLAYCLGWQALGLEAVLNSGFGIGSGFGSPCSRMLIGLNVEKCGRFRGHDSFYVVVFGSVFGGL